VLRDRNRLGVLVARLHAAARQATGDGRQRLAAAHAGLHSYGQSLTREHRLRLARVAGKLQALSPLAVLERGYCLASDGEGKVLTDAAAVAVGDTVALRLHRGTLQTKVVKS